MSEAEHDRGLANERTLLAWRRSAVSLLAVAALVLHDGLTGRVRPLLVAAAALLVLVAAVADGHGQRLYGMRTDGADARAQHAARVPRLLSGATVLAAFVVLVRALP